MNATPESSTRENRTSLLRWLAVVVAAVAAIALLMTYVARTVHVDSPVAPGEDLASAEQADFRLPQVDGDETGPPDFGGKVVVVDFWTTWCGPCRLQAAYLESMHEDYDASEVQFLAVNLGEDEATIRTFLAQNPFPYPVLMDVDNALSTRYEIYGLPTVMIIDKNGAIAFRHSGVLDKATLAEHVAQAGVPLPTGKEV